MSEQSNNFHIIYIKLIGNQEQIMLEQEKLTQDEFQELDEIRELREMVMDVQTKPQVLFTST